jgi:nucleoside-diphosphate-sugar epimerase
MKYLITGATGFIGKSLVKRLVDSDVLLVGREWQHDSSLPEKIKEFDPDYIIHCAAEIKDASKTFLSNVIMTNWLLETTLDTNYKAFINLGSSSEYGKIYKPVSENQKLNPRTMYEATKGAATLLCQGHAREYNKPIATVRPFSVYGIHEPYNRLIPTLFRNFEENKQSKISLGVHDFIHIDDFLDGLFAVLRSEPEVIKGDIVHFGCGVQYTNLEVFNLVKELFNSSLSPIKVDNVFNTYDTLTWVSDVTYAKAKYKFNPKHTLRSGLTELYETRYSQTKQKIA